ncbi:NADH-quinone oxidoreductase subunit C/D [Halolamina pelagica]|uniref:NADH-quinone oxidoreductase subunit C/D n=1 Tax=Halolamina pelagica TaxID=699431 RepID=A0A0N8I049_9EURY|nr:NADH-quinone oxidoreductase subunit D [Halolamina pelagica]KPN31315.1 NADH-quinone oxidoreductase subunit C/D [Halolamina pelagica]
MSQQVPATETVADDADSLAADARRTIADAGLRGAVVGSREIGDIPTLEIRADAVSAVLDALRTGLALDHCSSVVGQEYDTHAESVYLLRSYDDPTRALGVAVPVPLEQKRSQSGADAYRTAAWHEREAYDLMGIEYDEHPDLRRILLPETWQGHPLSRAYDQDRPQIVPFRENEQSPTDRPASAGDAGGTDTMFLNIGPHHPATHGVMHLEATLDGEQVVDVEPDIGYIHRCEEQMCESGTYRHQIMPYPDRWDWSGAGLCNEWSYARAAESLADIEVPEYAQVLRTFTAELSRMLGHFLAVGAYALDVIGDFTATFMYAIQARERVQDILEDITGQRLMFNYFRLGGVVWDLPEPREEFLESVRTFLAEVPERVQEFHDLLTANEILQMRTVDTGHLDPETAKQYGCTGPVARGSGIDYDIRRDDPYGYYDELDWEVPVEDGCDNYARLLVRLRELEESAKIVDQCTDLLESWPDADRTIQASVPRTIKPPEGAEVYETVEAAKGELGIYIRSDGTQQPGRFNIRGPSFSNLQALPEMANGGMVPDLIATLGSLDTIMGEVDR